ncbi:MAG: hypothetical protein PHS41_03950 [Victivallaceae bacterium]|nr:hypothetical protein [Victivallaceae bacterium]
MMLTQFCSLKLLSVGIAILIGFPILQINAAVEIPVWNLGIEEPHVSLHFGDVFRQNAKYMPMPDGKKALKIDLTTSTSQKFDSYFRSYRHLPDFSQATLSVMYYTPEKCGVTQFTVVLCDRNNERFPLTVHVAKTLGWHTAQIKLDAERKQPTPWHSSIRAGTGQKRDSGGQLNFYDQPMRIIGLLGRCQTVGAPANWIGFGPITLTVQSSRRAIRPDIVTGNAFHVLKKGEEEKLALQFYNPEDVAYQGNATMQITDAFGQNLGKKRIALSIPPGGAMRIPVSAPNQYGVYGVEILSQSQDRKDCQVRQSFCYMPPAGPTPNTRATGFLFGICTHFTLWHIDAETEAEAMALCGAKIIREATNWGESQQNKGLLLSHRYIDDPMEPFEKLGVEYQPVLLYTPKWAVAKDTRVVWPERAGEYSKLRPDYAEWRTYCRTYFSHTKGKIRYYEVWNEADIGFANFPWNEYIQLQRIAKEELKKINPSAKLITAGYALPPGAGHTDPNHMQKTLRDIGSYDILAYHGHSMYPQFKAAVGSVLQAIRQNAPGKPWYANETAMHSANIGELAQGGLLFQKLLLSWAKGAIGYTWYDLRDDGFDPSYSEHHFGMFTRDFYPKAVYGVFNTLAKHLTDAVFLREFSIPGIWEGYWFKGGNGDLYYGFWNERQSITPCLLSKITGTASLIDLFGNETPLEVRDGSVILPVNSLPKFLRIAKGGISEKMEGAPLIHPESEPFAVELKKQSIARFRVENPGTCPATILLNFSTDAPFSIQPVKQKLSLQPGENKMISVTLTPSAALTGHAATQAMQLTVSAQFNQQQLPNICVPLASVRNAVYKNFLPEQPQFHLGRAQDLFQIDMQPASLWQGEKDCSADIRMARFKDDLYVGIDVSDNIFFQKEKGFHCFKGDGVQLFFSIPGQQDFWEFGLALTPKGNDLYCYRMPKGQVKPEGIKTRISPLVGDGLRYELWIPLGALGLTEDAGKRGIRFNCYINDNDGLGRKCYLGIFPEKLSDRFPLIFFR